MNALYGMVFFVPVSFLVIFFVGLLWGRLNEWIDCQLDRDEREKRRKDKR